MPPPCVCSHQHDEHGEGGDECQVDGCGCPFYDADPDQDGSQ